MHLQPNTSFVQGKALFPPFLRFLLRFSVARDTTGIRFDSAVKYEKTHLICLDIRIVLGIIVCVHVDFCTSPCLPCKNKLQYKKISEVDRTTVALRLRLLTMTRGEFKWGCLALWLSLYSKAARYRWSFLSHMPLGREGVVLLKHDISHLHCYFPSPLQDDVSRRWLSASQVALDKSSRSSRLSNQSKVVLVDFVAA